MHRLPPNQQIRDYLGQGLANSFAGGSDRLVGTLTSKKFKMPKLFVHVRMGGAREEGKGDKAKLRFTVVADGHKSLHLLPKGNGGLQWMTLRLTKEIGRSCYFEIVDRSRDGHLVVDQIVLSDSSEPPKLSNHPTDEVLALLKRPNVRSLESLANAYEQLFAGVAKGTAGAATGLKRLDWALSPTGKLEDLAHFFKVGPERDIAMALNKAEEGLGRNPSQPRPASAQFAHSYGPPIRPKAQLFEALRTRRAVAEASIPESIFGMLGTDEDPHDVRVHIRGNHKNLGEVAPRRFLQIIAGDKQASVREGSGRLQLAEWMASLENPLTARVMVNRIWKHHFGQGIVRSVDNFGKTGELPTHPELLDFLAQRFIESGWSIKAMHRMMVLEQYLRHVESGGA